ncbi:hypothetical protein V8F20_012110 [Naviculisporaceae sp. PSN 640]
MPVPVVLATCAAVGSLVTSVKSGWELRRMIKRKQEQFIAEDEAPYIFRRLRRAHREGILNDREYEEWYEKFLVARAEKDLGALHRVRAHLRIMEAGAPGRALTNGSESNRSRSSSSAPSKAPPRRRRHSVDAVNLRDSDSPRRSISPRERRRRNFHRSEKESRYSSDEYESEREYDEKHRTRSPPSRRSRSTSVSQSRGRERRRDDEHEFQPARRSHTIPVDMEFLQHHHHQQPQSGGIVNVGARPDQFVPFAAPVKPKRASTVTGYAVAPGGGGIPVPILLPAPVTRRNSSASTAVNSRSSSSTATSRRRQEVDSGRETSDDDDETEVDTDVEENKKKWTKYAGKKQHQLPSSATRESRRRRVPWEKAMEEGRRPWEKKVQEEEESEWDEKRGHIRA